MDADNRGPIFKLGLVMAGAVSAGSYTAGVIDFLLEALDAIEDVRRGADINHLKRGLPDEKPIFDPPHKVQIGAMSGTSAGAIVTAITTTILGTRVPPVTSFDRFRAAKEDTGNPLYDSWVRHIHYDALLRTSDLKGPPVRSLLNSDELGKVAQDVLKLFSKKHDDMRPYFAEGLPVFLCVSNLRGVRYSLKLESGDAGNEYQMSLHADHIGFCFRSPRKEEEVVGMLSLTPGETEGNWQMLGNAALASSAFPFGLAARPLKRDFSDYEGREWFVASAERPPIRRERYGKKAEPPDDPASWRSQSGEFRRIPPLDKEADFPPNGRYEFANVDGGVFNNEPLELCRLALAGEEGRIPRNPLEATLAVLLIDPFPNLFKLDKQYNAHKAIELMPVARRIFGAVLSQARFKPDELTLAKDPNVASRFAIFPVRYGENH